MDMRGKHGRQGLTNYCRGQSLRIVPLKEIEYGFGYAVTRSPYTPYSIYLTGTIQWMEEILHHIVYPISL